MTHSADRDLSEFLPRLRTWLALNVPVDAWSGPPRGPHDVAAARSFQRALFDAGLAGLSWPERWGGRGLTDDHERMFASEAYQYELPVLVFTVGLGMCLPALLGVGTDAQRERYVASALRGDEIWSLLVSEPGAGSDVAGVRTKAERVEGGFLLTGQKVWTTAAQFADLGLVLARTDATVPKHEGLTAFIVDMHAAGLDVRPLRDVTGASEFNEVFFDGVFVADDAVLGEVGGGWRVATAVFEHERRAVSVGLGTTGKIAAPLGLSELAEHAARDGRLGELAERIAEQFLRERVADLMNREIGELLEAGRDPGALVSMTKLSVAQNSVLAADLALRVFGSDALIGPEDSRTAARIDALAGALRLSIGGGTNEIQRDVIGDRILGLPREPRADRGPFDELARSEREGRQR